MTRQSVESCGSLSCSPWKNGWPEHWFVRPGTARASPTSSAPPSSALEIGSDRPRVARTGTRAFGPEDSDPSPPTAGSQVVPLPASSRENSAERAQGREAVLARDEHRADVDHLERLRPASVERHVPAGDVGLPLLSSAFPRCRRSGWPGRCRPPLAVAPARSPRRSSRELDRDDPVLPRPQVSIRKRTWP